LLREIFAMEVTNAEETCRGCGTVNEMGRVEVYIHAPGTVIRCPACHNVLMRIVHGRGRYWVDMSGMRTLELIEG
jgi:Zn finger protein HypA/HybF involved in hydrogenase expression